MIALPDEISTTNDPKINVAMRSKEKDYWQEAIHEEIETLTKSNTWTTEEKPPATVKLLLAMVILKLKQDNDGNPERFKARVVALGNLQDLFGNTVKLWGPVTCIELFRTLFSVMLHERWTVKQLDVKGAFLHAYHREEELWIKLLYIPTTHSYLV